MFYDKIITLYTNLHRRNNNSTVVVVAVVVIAKKKWDLFWSKCIFYICLTQQRVMSTKSNNFRVRGQEAGALFFWLLLGHQRAEVPGGSRNDPYLNIPSLFYREKISYFWQNMLSSSFKLPSGGIKRKWIAGFTSPQKKNIWFLLGIYVIFYYFCLG